jgi:hypothetical protein
MALRIPEIIMTKLATKTNKLGQRTDLIEVNDH